MEPRRKSLTTGVTEKGTAMHDACRFRSNKPWLERQYNQDGTIKKPDQLEKEMKYPPDDIDDDIIDRIHGSMIGMALGDALGAFVEFRSHEYMVQNPVTTLKGGGTWGLRKGQFTDDTSMGLCLANSLVARQGYVPYDQLVRYKWWHKEGYMSSTGRCFDIGSATRQSLIEFERRQQQFAIENDIPPEQLDFLSDSKLLDAFDINCSKEGVAGNGALMRLTPVPLFFYRDPVYAIKCSGHSGEITHGDEKAYDACRYYGALIVAAVGGATKNELLDDKFYTKHKEWFGNKPLHSDVMEIVEGSYKKRGGYADGIRGKGYIVKALEAALWSFWFHEKSFEEGALAAVNLGDDTDTTAAIYGQLAGAYYGYSKLRKDWVAEVYAKQFIECLSKWIAFEGNQWYQKRNVAIDTSYDKGKQKQRRNSMEHKQSVRFESSVSQESDDPKSNFRPRRYTIHNTYDVAQPDSHEPRSSDGTTTTRKGDPKSSFDRIYIHKNVKTTDDVCKWLISLDDDYEIYTKSLKDHDINGYWLLNHVGQKELIKYGVEREDHRQHILSEIEQLKTQCPATFATPE